jgi:hypothetical protein
MLARSIPGIDFGRPRRVLLTLALLALVLAVFARVERAGATTEQPAVAGQGATVLAGTVWFGDRPAPPGTILVARIGTVVCGVTLVTEPAPGLNYRLTVLGADERPGCGADGASISVLVTDEVAGVRSERPLLFAGGTMLVADVVILGRT